MRRWSVVLLLPQRNCGIDHLALELTFRFAFSYSAGRNTQLAWNVSLSSLLKRCELHVRQILTCCGTAFFDCCCSGDKLRLTLVKFALFISLHLLPGCLSNEPNRLWTVTLWEVSHILTSTGGPLNLSAAIYGCGSKNNGNTLSYLKPDKPHLVILR